MKKISVLTATRAEYGLLKNIIVKLKKIPEFEVQVVVTGMHLSPEFGLTYKEIEQDGIHIYKKIDILLSGDNPACISKSMGLALMGFAEYFKEEEPDLLVVLGDRYETLAVSIAAMNQRVPIAHLYGGETTEGAVDESIRHAITKMSYLHFTSTEVYRNRVIQLGEHPDRVFCVGAMGIENAKKVSLLSKQELETSIQYDLVKPFAVVTFHPITLEHNTSREQCQELLDAMDSFPDMQFIITKANADADGRVINQMLEEYVAQRENCFIIDSLGMKRYLSALKYCSFVLGNSSSGIIEAPSFEVATVNIGERQKGRIQADSVINCDPKKNEIVAAMRLALKWKECGKLYEVINPYGDGNTSEKIVNEIYRLLVKSNIILKKSFYDI